MRIVLAPDSFKGSATATEVVAALASGIEHSAPDSIIIEQPLSDGGEGTLELLLHHGFSLHTLMVPGSWGTPTEASFALSTHTAVIESAQAFGFLPGATSAHALEASSAGVGALILAALDHAPGEILLTVGGTSGTDAGIGMLQALGARCTDVDGLEIGPGGGALAELVSVDVSGLDPRLATTRVRVLTDVINTLLGPSGAAASFAPQKGADALAVGVLQEGLARVASVIDSDAAMTPGSGAGGGLAYAAMAMLGARQESGARAMIELTGVADNIQSADLVVTGEGSFDNQSLGGKITGAIIDLATSHDVPVVVVCGVAQPGMERPGVRVIEIGAMAPSRQASIDHPEEYLRVAGTLIGEFDPSGSA
jgi:glycerate kinase